MAKQEKRTEGGVALEGLLDCLGRRGRDIDELLAAADACRVRRVMMPYVDSLA